MLHCVNAHILLSVLTLGPACKHLNLHSVLTVGICLVLSNMQKSKYRKITGVELSRNVQLSIAQGHAATRQSKVD